MKIYSNERVLCLRVSNLKGKNFLDEHKKVLDNYGCVWVGKAGRKPQVVVLEEMFKEKAVLLIFKNSDKYYYGVAEQYSYTIDQVDGYPEYYKLSKLLKLEDLTWFKLIELNEILNQKILDQFIIISSKNTLRSTFRNSMSSFFYAKCVTSTDTDDFSRLP